MEVEFTRDELAEKIANTQNMIILKFGAPWCGPCKRVDPIVAMWKSVIETNNLPIELMSINVDESFDLFAFLRSKKLVPSIPTVLAWKGTNREIYPDQSVLGTDDEHLNEFFNWCKSNCK